MVYLFNTTLIILDLAQYEIFFTQNRPFLARVVLRVSFMGVWSG